MLQIWEEHKKKIIGFLAILITIVALILGKGNLNASVIESAVGFIVTPFQELMTGTGSWLESSLSSKKDMKELVDENLELKNEIAIMKQENARLDIYEEENEKLSELLKITEKYPDYPSVGAEVIAKNPGVWYEIFTINKGMQDDVSANMILVSSGGVVGKVLESGETYSKAQSMLDSRSSIPAMSSRTKDLGIVKGDSSLMEKGLCKMEYIDAQAQIVEGDEIVTSHLSEIYPEGLPIGKVKEIKMDSNGLTKYAIIQPYVDLKHLDTVLVLDKEIREESP